MHIFIYSLAKKISNSRARYLANSLFYVLVQLSIAVIMWIFLGSHSVNAEIDKSDYKSDWSPDDKVFKTPAHINSMLNDSSLRSASISPQTAYVLVKITGKELFERTKTRISFNINDLVYFTNERIKAPKNGYMIHHPALSWSAEARLDELRIGDQYLFVVGLNNGKLQLDPLLQIYDLKSKEGARIVFGNFNPLKQIYKFNDPVRERFEQFKRIDQAGRRSSTALAEAIKQELRKNLHDGLALFKLSSARLAKKDIRQVGYEVYVAAGDLYEADRALTSDGWMGADPPDAEDLFLSLRHNMKLKDLSASCSRLADFFRKRFDQGVVGKNGALLDVPYWNALIADISQLQVSSDSKEMEEFIIDWTRYRACGLPEISEGSGSLSGWDKQLRGFDFFTACEQEPDRTAVWFSSLPAAKSTDSKLIKILEKPYKIDIESADSQKRTAVLSSSAVFPERITFGSLLRGVLSQALRGLFIVLSVFNEPSEESDPSAEKRLWFGLFERAEVFQKRLLGYQVECKNNACKSKPKCYVKKSESGFLSRLLLRLPINPDFRKSQMEDEFMRLVFGISNDSAKFKELLESQREIHRDLGTSHMEGHRYLGDLYPSFESYVQLVNDVKSACKF